VIPRERPQIHWSRPDTEFDPSQSRRWLVGLLPVGVLVFLEVFAQDWMRPTLDASSEAAVRAGLFTLVIAGILTVAGLLVMRRFRSRAHVAIAFACLTLPAIVLVLIVPVISLVAAATP
jgi:hypothetical protein